MFLNTKIPRIIIAGSHSGVGKTTVVTGLMGALIKKKLTVQGFKVGPDYIDTSYHTMITNKYSRNLDTWMVSREGILEIFQKASKSADIAIIEGVMGLYDGFSGLDDTGSTAEIAKLLNAPVILVIDVSEMSRSSAALVLGYKHFDKNVKLVGVIANGLASPTHAQWVKEAIETYVRIPILGSLPFKKTIKMPERHLGLIPTREKGELSDFFSSLASFVEENVDLDKIIKIAQSAEEFPKHVKYLFPSQKMRKKITIGVAFDEAFNFYYWDNIDLLKAFGAEIKFFSPIHDDELPTIDGLYIGGGFPEMLAKDLATNNIMKQRIKKIAEDGIPIYAECGGLMYLTDSMVDFNGVSSKMVGLFSGTTIMTKSLEALNYTIANVVSNTILSTKGTTLKGHEFHFSKITNISKDARFAYEMKIGKGIDGKHDGWLEYNVLASYMHMHFGYDVKIIKNFIKSCKKYRQK